MKKMNLLRKIIIACVIIITVEIVLMFGVKISRERKINRIDMISHVEKIEGGYLGVGMSDFHDSKYVQEKFYDYEDSRIIQTQAKLVRYDNDFNVLWESSLNTDFDATYYDAIEISDGYIAVGSKVKNKDGIKDNVREAVIVKYNKEGKVLWNKTYEVLSDTEFYKIIDDGDGNFVVVGQSIYENLEMGYHIIGGGIIVRYNSEGEVIAHNNYGGNHSGSFNDIVKVNDGYIVCGKDAINYGILVKFKKDFNRDDKDTNLITKKVMWQRTYTNTDDKGFTSMVRNNDILYLAGAINVSNEKDDEGKIKFKYDAGLVTYNLNGKLLGKYSLGEEIHHRINDIAIKDNILNILVHIDVDSYSKGGLQNAKILKYELPADITKLGNSLISKKEYLSDKHNYILNELELIDNKLLLVGATDNNCGIYGCDYKPIIEEIE